MNTPVLLAWSGGKDCLAALARLRADAEVRVIGLLTTVNRHFDRIAMHGIRRDVLEAQAAALELPLLCSEIDWPSGNDAYTAAFTATLADARARWPDLADVAFGDIALADVRAWRERQLAEVGWRTRFPLWAEDTARLARDFVAAGHRAVIACVDTQQLDARFSGCEFDGALLDALPAAVDACGERGEFHTLSYAGPMFARPLTLQRGESLLRDERLQYTDFVLAAHA